MESVPSLPLIVADNCTRLPQFRTRTIITESNGHKIVQKQALTEQAIPFLKLIIECERKNVGYLKGRFDSLCGSLMGNVIEYEYLSYQSLLNNIASHLADRRWADADRLFQDYVNRLNSLPKIQIVPKEFLKMFDGDENAGNQELECLSRGLLDLTPRNILVDGDRWIIVDHEWSFDFPVPVVFVVFRAVREAAVVLQSQIRAAASQIMPMTDIFALGLQKLYVPVLWAQHITDTPVTSSRMLRWELGFQRYVRGSSCRSVGRIISTPKTRTKFSAHAYARRRHLVTAVRKALKVLPGLRGVLDSVEKKSFDLDR